MSVGTPDSTLLGLLETNTHPVRELIRRAVEMLRAGQAAAAVRMLRDALPTSEARSDDHRTILATIVSLIAAIRLEDGDPVERLQESGAEQRVFAQTRRSTVDAAMEWLRAEANAAAQADPVCPNCGSRNARPMGAAPLAGGPAMAQISTSGLLFDMERLRNDMSQDPPVTTRGWGVIASRLVLQMQLSAPVVQCDDCSLYYLRWPEDPERTARYYKDFADPSRTVRDVAVTGRAHSLETCLDKARFPAFVRAHLGDLKGKRILDLGCGEGVMLACLREYGSKPVGYDLDVKRIQYASIVLGLEDVTFDKSRFDALPDGVLDVALSFHALEHIPAVDDTLATVARLVRPGGRLVFAVPSVTWHDGVAHGMGGDHLIGFTQQSLRAAFERHGLTVDMQAAGQSLPQELRSWNGSAVWSGLKDDMLLVASKPRS